MIAFLADLVLRNEAVAVLVQSRESVVNLFDVLLGDFFLQEQAACVCKGSRVNREDTIEGRGTKRGNYILASKDPQSARTGAGAGDQGWTIRAMLADRVAAQERSEARTGSHLIPFPDLFFL